MFSGTLQPYGRQYTNFLEKYIGSPDNKSVATRTCITLDSLSPQSLTYKRRRKPATASRTEAYLISCRRPRDQRNDTTTNKSAVQPTIRHGIMSRISAQGSFFRSSLLNKPITNANK